MISVVIVTVEISRMGFLQGKLLNSVLTAALCNKPPLCGAVFAGSLLLQKLGENNTSDVAREKKKNKNQEDPTIHRIPTWVSCGTFVTGTSTVAVGDWICKTYSEMSIYLIYLKTLSMRRRNIDAVFFFVSSETAVSPSSNSCLSFMVL